MKGDRGMGSEVQASGFVVQPRLQFKSLRDQMIYQYLIAKVKYVEIGNINIGQTIIKLTELEKETAWSRRMIKFSLDRLVDQGYIQQKTLMQKRGVLITITSYEDLQKLDFYKKSKQKNVQENEHPMNNQCTSNEQENVQENESDKPYGSRGDDVSKIDNVQENEQVMNNQCTSDVQENEQLISITAFITALNNSNINKTLKEYLESATVKSMNLTSTDDIEIFVDFALLTNAFPEGTSRKILIAYFDSIRMTRQTCNISAKLLANLIEKLGKYSVNQLNYVLWLHCEQHDDKKEQYTLGILRNTDEPKARRGLMKLKNKNGGEQNATPIASDEEFQKYDFGF